MARIILIHGAWGTRKTWAAVAPLLTAAGHDVEALDLPGHGESAVPPDQVGMAEYVAHVEAVLAGGPPAVLVGHSMGGMVIAQVAARQPARVRACVYVAALLPRDGESLLDLIRQQDARGVQDAVRPGPLRGTTVLEPELAAQALFPDASPAQAARAMQEVCAQSNKAQGDPAILGGGFAQVPRAYVFCAQDRVVTLALQQEMVARTPCEAVFTLDSGHVPQLTQPKALARILDGLAQV
ncbi:alpha/beta fold hydrolase [Pararhodobacter oceanensis]|uniref:AB hydrolase-1 domain-containing protein n=1 Tax=Pararhodobacter oceanensis TaxID=2172121 RepID=A0A2T8HYX3_9RHOB|nr:alpha/beta hydrolase [Pararhodobacter oceanensis]PVH30624.1 hypothetical protein DDE20_03640 [Pararhodobacter oceanensis]